MSSKIIYITCLVIILCNLFCAKIGKNIKPKENIAQKKQTRDSTTWLEYNNANVGIKFSYPSRLVLVTKKDSLISDFDLEFGIPIRKEFDNFQQQYEMLLFIQSTKEDFRTIVGKYGNFKNIDSSWVVEGEPGQEHPAKLIHIGHWIGLYGSAAYGRWDPEEGYIQFGDKPREVLLTKKDSIYSVFICVEQNMESKSEFNKLLNSFIITTGK